MNALIKLHKTDKPDQLVQFSPRPDQFPRKFFEAPTGRACDPTQNNLPKKRIKLNFRNGAKFSSVPTVRTYFSSKHCLIPLKFWAVWAAGSAKRISGLTKSQGYLKSARSYVLQSLNLITVSKGEQFILLFCKVGHFAFHGIF